MNTLGFQGSETSSVEVTIYHQGNDPVLLTGEPRAVHFRGGAIGDKEASVIAVNTKKSMGSSSGSFTVTLKPSQLMGRSIPFLEDTIADDDWIDITFFRHGRPFHTLRGIVETVSRSVSVSGQTTTREYTIQGRDHGAVFDRTQVFYDKFSGELPVQVTIGLFDASTALGTPSQLVEKILYGYMAAQADFGRANWVLPRGMPGSQATFAQTLFFANQFQEDFAPRRCIAPQLIDPSGIGIWQLAQEYSDPTFTELFTDLVADAGATPFAPDEESSPGETEMAVIYRDKPFINTVDGTSSPWFALPLVEVPRSHITKSNTSTTTNDRYNAFFVTPSLFQDNVTRGLTGPLWDKDSMKRHGLRMMNVDSRYTADNDPQFVEYLRERVRDWHCLSAYFHSGSLTLGRLYPDIRLGTRVRIPGESLTEQMDYYVESVAHMWRAGSAGRTDLGVTRGWRGGDTDQLRTLERVASLYTQEVR